MSTKKLNGTGLSQVWAKIVELFVAKEDGKGLSTNDYTTDEKQKLAGIAKGATNVTVDTALSSSSTNPVQNKVINTALAAKAPLASPALTGTPTAPTAASGTSTTQIATTKFVADTVAEAISSIQGIRYSVVASLPSTGEAGVIYLVSNSGAGNNVYDEYIWLGSAYEKLGTTEVDLSGYLKSADLVDITEAEINEICVLPA